MAESITQFWKSDKDGEWRLDLSSVKNHAFAQWKFQRYKSTPLGWIEMGRPSFYYTRHAAITNIYRLGYREVV